MIQIEGLRAVQRNNGGRIAGSFLDRRSTHSGPPRTDLERNQRIAEARADGERLASIGKRYGVSRERVRQITKALGVGKPPPKVSAQQLRWATKRESAKLFTGTDFDRAEVLRLTGWADEGTDLGLCDRLYREYKLIRCGLYVRCARCEKFKPFTEHLPGYMNSQHYLACKPCNAARARKWYETHDWPAPGPNQALYGRRAQLKKAGRLDEMPPLDVPYTAKTHPESMRQYWANMEPAQKAARIEKMVARSQEGRAAWWESLTLEQKSAYFDKIRSGARRWSESLTEEQRKEHGEQIAAGRAKAAAQRHGGAV